MNEAMTPMLPLCILEVVKVVKLIMAMDVAGAIQDAHIVPFQKDYSAKTVSPPDTNLFLTWNLTEVRT